MIKINFLSRQKGIGLLELMLSLAIIAILLVMATRYYLMADVSSRVNTALNVVGGLDGAIEHWQQQPNNDLSKLDLKTCVTNGWIPSNIVDSNGDLITPWGDVAINATANDVMIGLTPGTDKEAINLCYRFCSGEYNKIDCTSQTGGKVLTYAVKAQTCT